MAYISATDVQAIRTELKQAFPKFKFAVRKGSGSLSVDVVIKQATFAFQDQFEKQGRRYAQVNQYWIKDHFQDAEERHFIERVNEIMHNAPGRAGGREYFDESDAMTDYFHTAFYTHLSIGQWDKEYTCIEG
jgi:chemotaxis regulatin CheY-phosphate phosphatase CheZ